MPSFSDIHWRPIETAGPAPREAPLIGLGGFTSACTDLHIASMFRDGPTWRRLISETSHTEFYPVAWVYPPMPWKGRHAR